MARAVAKTTAASAAAASTKDAMRILAPQKARRPDGEREQEEAEGHGRRPGRAVEGGREAFGDAEQQRAHERAREAPEAPEDADGEDAPDVVAPDRGLHRLDDDQERPGDRGRGDRDAEGDA